MVLAQMYKEKRDRERRAKIHAEWEEWMRARDEARENNQPFNTPSPSERDRQLESNR